MKIISFWFDDVNQDPFYKVICDEGFNIYTSNIVFYSSIARIFGNIYEYHSIDKDTVIKIWKINQEQFEQFKKCVTKVV